MDKYSSNRISELEDALYHATRGKANSEYVLSHEIDVLSIKLDKAIKALNYIKDPDLAYSSIKEAYIDEHYRNVAAKTIKEIEGL